jgi:hypothetical protein
LFVRVAIAAVLAALGACGRIDFDRSPERGDGGPLPSDGDLDAPTPCTFGPFGAPVTLPGPINSSVDEWTPAISASDLTLVFYSQRLSVPGDPDIWISTRPSASSEFEAATVITEVSSPDADHAPQLSADELVLVFASDRGSPGQYDLYEATRTSTAQPFGVPQKLDELSSPFHEETIWLSGDGLRVLLSSNVGSSYDIYAAERPDRSAPFGPLTVISELSTGYFEGSPALSSDELEIFFVSNRPGVGAYDVWHSTRPTRTSPFDVPTAVPSISSTGDEWGLSLSADGRTLYFSYDAPLSGGDANIWIATRACQ